MHTRSLVAKEDKSMIIKTVIVMTIMMVDVDDDTYWVESFSLAS